MYSKDCKECKWVVWLVALGLGVRCKHPKNNKETELPTKNEETELPILISKVPLNCEYKTVVKGSSKRNN